jgi:nucleoside 2-deoxyribosyltransferase
MSRKVYFARAMDGIEDEDIHYQAKEVSELLERYNLQIIDPFIAVDRHQTTENFEDVALRIVEADLELLRTADAVLMDCSIPGRSYVGCICELVYAHLWGIPVVVYVGTSGNDKRYWLVYHANEVHTEWGEAISGLLSHIQRTDQQAEN